jgi:hypothetical protein
LSGWFVSVLGREIVNLKNVVIFAVLGLSMGKGYNEEFWFNLFNSFALCQNRWNHVIWAWLSD